MIWIIAIAIIAVVIGTIITESLDSTCGKIVISAAVVAIGLLLLAWITDIDFFITLAKVCAAVIVVTIVGAILLAIIGH